MASARRALVEVLPVRTFLALAAVGVLLAACDSPLVVRTSLEATKAQADLRFLPIAGTTSFLGVLAASPSFPSSWLAARSLKVVVSGVSYPLTRQSETAGASLSFAVAAPLAAPPNRQPVVLPVIVGGERVDLLAATVATN